MSILNVDKIQPIGGGSTITVDATDIQATSATITASDISIADKIIHTGDANTSLRFPSADTITAETSGSERLRILSNGNIGIGTDTAPHKLSVKGTISKISGTSGIQLVNIANDASNHGTIAINQSGGVERIKLHSSGVSYFNGGNLFINKTTTSDYGKFEVKGGTADNIETADITAKTVATFSGSTPGTTAAGKGAGIVIKPIADRGCNYFLGVANDSTNQEAHGRFIIRSGNFAGTTSERLRIDSSGNIGINDSSPSFKLDVNGTGRFTDDLTINTTKKIQTNSSTGQLTIQPGPSYPGGSIKFAGGQSGATDRGTLIFYAGETTSLQERLRIDSSGRLQMGSDPSNLGAAKFNIVTGGDDGISLGRLQGANVSSGDVLGTIAFQTAVGSQTTNSAEASIKAIAAENTTGSTAATNLSFYTKPTGTGPGSSPTERLCITSGGVVLINQTTVGAKSAPAPLQLISSASGAFGLNISMRSNNDYGFISYTDNDASEDLVQLGVQRTAADKGDLIIYTNAGNTSATERLRIKDDGRVMSNISGNRGGIGLVGAFMARPTSTYSTNSGLLKINLATEEFDANGWFNTSNSRYTPLCKGWYQFNFFIQYRTNINSQSVEMFLYPYKNGASSNGGPVHGWNTNYGNYAFITFSTMIYCDGDDYIEMYANCSRNTEVSVNSRMSGFLVHPVA